MKHEGDNDAINSGEPRRHGANFTSGNGTS